MSLPLDHPFLVLALTLPGLWLAALSGAWLRKVLGFDKDTRQDLGVVLAAALTLLGLLIGFSFSMAAGRFDQRKNLEEAEANAIGTEFLRADLLAAADRARVRELLKKYVELRIRFYLADSRGELGPINAETSGLQNEMWAAVVASAGRQPDPVVALVVSGMNDVINAQGYTLAAWRYRVPVSAVVLMAAIAVLCNVLVGYSSSVPPLSIVLLILPVLVAIAFMLIDDIDTPRRGLIRVPPNNLFTLLDGMKVP
jgi:hypothetical protein